MEDDLKAINEFVDCVTSKGLGYAVGLVRYGGESREEFKQRVIQHLHLHGLMQDHLIDVPASEF